MPNPKLFDIQVVHLNIALITPEFVSKLHSEGLIAYGSNLETADEMRVCLARGIDSFSTGAIETAIRVRDENTTA